MKIDIDQLLEEVLTMEDPRFVENQKLLVTSKIATKAADIVINSVTDDPVMILQILTGKHTLFVNMVYAAILLGFSVGRLYGRTELIQELEENKK